MILSFRLWGNTHLLKVWEPQIESVWQAEHRKIKDNSRVLTQLLN